MKTLEEKQSGVEWLRRQARSLMLDLRLGGR
jgi:hypothetical protein